MSDDLRTRLAALADEWERFDCVALPEAVPAHVDVPDDFEAGIHDAAAGLRALLAEPVACLVSTAAVTAQSAAPQGGDAEALVGWVHVTHADPEEYARIFNEGYEAAMTQHLADDPGAADDWLAAHDAEVRASAARETAERIAAAIEACCKARVENNDQRLNFSKGATAAYTHAARIARAEDGAR